MREFDQHPAESEMTRRCVEFGRRFTSEWMTGELAIRSVAKLFAEGTVTLDPDGHLYVLDQASWLLVPEFIRDELSR